MLIKSFEIEHVSLPDEDPNWKFSGQAYPTNDAVILTITSEDGSQGLGYAAAFPHLGATASGVEGALKRMCPKLVGRDAMALEANIAMVDAALVGNNPAKSAIDCALHDLKARLLQVPLYELLGGKVTDRIAICRMLGLKLPHEMAERAQRLVDQGYRHLKLKVGATFERTSRGCRRCASRSATACVWSRIPTSRIERRTRWCSPSVPCSTTSTSSSSRCVRTTWTACVT